MPVKGRGRRIHEASLFIEQIFGYTFSGDGGPRFVFSEENMAYSGELAALFTSVCWAFAAVGFTFASARVGSLVTNRIRVLIAFLALMVINLVLYGQLLPLDAGPERWFWLTLSGVVGLAVGDACLFQSFQDVGPRIGLLLLSLAPIFGSAMAWLFFGETLTPIQLTGVLVTLAGI